MRILGATTTRHKTSSSGAKGSKEAGRLAHARRRFHELDEANASHLRQAARSIEPRTGQSPAGKLIARHDTRATLLDESVRGTWKIPYLAIEGALNAAYDPPPEPAKPQGLIEFMVGKVTFDNCKGNVLVGIVMRINRRTATRQAMDGKTWRVDFQLLRHVVHVLTTSRPPFNAGGSQDGMPSRLRMSHRRETALATDTSQPRRTRSARRALSTTNRRLKSSKVVCDHFATST